MDDPNDAVLILIETLRRKKHFDEFPGHLLLVYKCDMFLQRLKFVGWKLQFFLAECNAEKCPSIL